eukprot:14557-Pyramimonas_sp.AAC.1
MQNSGQAPSAFKHVANPALGKGEGIFPEGQRLLSVLSAWLYAWEVPIHRSGLAPRVEAQAGSPREFWGHVRGPVSRMSPPVLPF